MARYDFDQLIDRRGTDCLKYDFALERGRPADVLPLWVADMDFAAPEPVLDALRRRVDHGIFGYTDAKEGYYRAVEGWFRRRYGWQTQPSWLVKTPGVVFALAMAVRALTRPGEGVVIQPPVYYPFFSVIRNNGRTLVENRLLCQDGRCRMDLEDLERRLTQQNVKLLFLCSPHNPVGRVWTAEELRQLGALCRKHHVYVVSDEIHCDFAFPEHPHQILLQAVPELQDQAIVCTAPSKTFNLAGLQVSNIWIPNEALRKRFVQEMDACGYSQLNTLGLTAAQAAYEGGEEWLEECRRYLRGNLDYLREFLQKKLPQIHLVEPEGTYLAWLDCSGLGLCRRELDELVTQGAGLWLDSGHIFGGGADQYQRMVLACPRSTLAQALEQLERAIRSR